MKYQLSLVILVVTGFMLTCEARGYYWCNAKCRDCYRGEPDSQRRCTFECLRAGSYTFSCDNTNENEPTEVPPPECPMICTMEYNPQCGSDGKTYGNPCTLKIAQCNNAGIELVHPGKCLPECPLMCTREFNPQCGSDGKTYNNPCELEVAQCNNADLGIELLHTGECLPACPEFCTLEYNPQCGSDGNTYSNLCDLQVAQCNPVNAGLGLELAYEGECSPTNVEISHVCERSTFYMECPAGEKISVKSALYGRQNSDLCPNTPMKTTACSADNALYVVQQQCEGQETCEIQASNGVFGDPCRGTNKYLQIDYECITAPTNVEISHVCERSTFYMECPAGEKISVKSALYGRQNSDLCPNTPMKTTVCSANMALDIVQQQCEGQETCEVQANNGVFGDPCPGTHKYLQIDYECITVCPDVCPFLYDPQCGSDGVTYGNLCNLQQAQCRRSNAGLVLAYKGNC